MMLHAWRKWIEQILRVIQLLMRCLELERLALYAHRICRHLKQLWRMLHTWRKWLEQIPCVDHYCINELDNFTTL